MSNYRELVNAWLAGRKAERDYADNCVRAAEALHDALRMNLDHQPVEAHPHQPERPEAGGSHTVASSMSLKEDAWYQLRFAFTLAEGANVFPKLGVSWPAEVKIAGGRVRYRLPGAETTIAWPLEREGAQKLSNFVDLVTAALQAYLARGVRGMVERDERAAGIGFLWEIEEHE